MEFYKQSRLAVEKLDGNLPPELEKTVFDLHADLWRIPSPFGKWQYKKSENSTQAVKRSNQTAENKNEVISCHKDQNFGSSAVWSDVEVNKPKPFLRKGQSGIIIRFTLIFIPFAPWLLQEPGKTCIQS